MQVAQRPWRLQRKEGWIIAKKGVRVTGDSFLEEVASEPGIEGYGDVLEQRGAWGGRKEQRLEGRKWGEEAFGDQQLVQPHLQPCYTPKLERNTTLSEA